MKVCFFMAVTPRDVVIADYAIRSYGKITGLDFELVVYANGLTEAQRRFYFPRWKRLPRVRVDLSEPLNSIRHDDKTISSLNLRGPYQLHDLILDTELRKIQADYIVAVDADFEILNQRFVHHIFDALDSDRTLIGYSTDSSPGMKWFSSYSNETIFLRGRYHTWFCAYRREAFTLSDCRLTSHGEEASAEMKAQGITKSVWDTSAHFQESLQALGYRFRSLPENLRGDYMHYGAFSKNMSITRSRVMLYRAMKLREKHFLGRRLHTKLGRRFLALVGIDDAVDKERGRYQKHTLINW